MPLLLLSGGGGSAPLPDDLVDAIVATINAALVGPGYLTEFSTCAPEEPTLPYAVLEEPDEDDEGLNTQGDMTADGHLQITCYAATKKAARGLGDQVAAALNDAPLQFAAGVLVFLRQASRTAMQDPDPAPGGGDCWNEIRIFHFTYAYPL